jgi:hypothetical protein
MEIGFDFTKCPIVFIFIIPYENNSYVHFWHPANWLCFAYFYRVQGIGDRG